MRELRQRITFNEFLGWLDYLSQEEERLTKEDLYFAQIAAEVRRANVKNPRSVKIDHFLVKRSSESVPAPKSSKSIWLSAVGLNFN